MIRLQELLNHWFPVHFLHVSVARWWLYVFLPTLTMKECILTSIFHALCCKFRVSLFLFWLTWLVKDPHCTRFRVEFQLCALMASSCLWSLMKCPRDKKEAPCNVGWPHLTVSAVHEVVCEMTCLVNGLWGQMWRPELATESSSDNRVTEPWSAIFCAALQGYEGALS